MNLLLTPHHKCYGPGGYHQVPCTSHSATPSASISPSARPTASPSTVTSTTPAPQLPQTGPPIATFVTVALVLLVLGIGLVLRTRRKREARHAA